MRRQIGREHTPDPARLSPDDGTNLGEPASNFRMICLSRADLGVASMLNCSTRQEARRDWHRERLNKFHELHRNKSLWRWSLM